MTKPKLALRPPGSLPQPAQVEQFVAYGTRHPDIQTSEHSDAPPATREASSPRGPGLVQRQSGVVRRRMTVYLPPALAQSLQICSVQEGREISEMVSDAVQEYLSRRDSLRND